MGRSINASIRPRARLVSILGEHLISDHVVGLIELVKNSYDADAQKVQVSLRGLGDAQQTEIDVEDDGIGMSTADVIDKFLSPAVDHKARCKRDRVRSPRGRLPIGEKGVGRFAVQQLGRELELITRAAGQPEVRVSIDWSCFEDSEAFLEEIPLSVVEREPEAFPGGKTGTRLRILKSRSPWTEAAVRKLQRGLRRLQSPHVEMLDFSVGFQCLDYPQYESLDPGDILEHHHYRFYAAVDSNGLMSYEYEVKHPATETRREEGDHDLQASARAELSADGPSCGPLYVNLYVWDRTAEYLQDSNVSRQDLDAMAGVSLFRDRLRVLPYGELGDDWLSLDRERINNPSGRISNNQVIGFVEIDQETATDLRDKTSREGLVENDAFRDLRAMARTAIAFFHTLWLKDRPGGGARKKRVSADKPLGQARTLATALHQSALPDVRVEVQRPGNGSIKPSTEEEDSSQTSTTQDVMVVTQQEASRMLVEEIDEVIRVDRHNDGVRRDMEDILLHLAATGMAAERVVHEVGRQAVAALKAIEIIRMGGSAAAEALGVLESCLATLRNEFRALAPYEGVVRFQKRARVNVREAVNVAVEINRHHHDFGTVELIVRGGPFDVMARPATLVQVFDNLIHNAWWWVQNSPDEPRICIELDADRRTVSVSDTGSGVPVHLETAIFEPFVTTRPGGRGLGLYITRELLRSGGGSVRLDSSEAGGARFVVDLSGYPGPTQIERGERGQDGAER